jgi:hypothetical protein
MTKKNVLIISSVYIIYTLVLILVGTFCESVVCRIREDDFFGRILFFFLPLTPVFIFSLITYKLPEQVFRYWWKFAVWFVPLIIVATTWVDTLHSGGGWGTPDLTSALVYILLYSVFVGISFVRIFIAWWEVKTGQIVAPAKKSALMAAIPILTYGILWLMMGW